MSTLRGIYSPRAVSDPGVGQGDTYYATMHVCDNTDCDRWGEIGWYKFDDGTRGLFIYSTDSPTVYTLGSGFPLTTGQTVFFQISWVGAPVNKYYQYLWWYDQWNIIGSFGIGQTNSGRTDIVSEAITDGTHFSLANTQHA
jgi:hypothetical protein